MCKNRNAYTLYLIYHFNLIVHDSLLHCSKQQLRVVEHWPVAGLNLNSFDSNLWHTKRKGKRKLMLPYLLPSSGKTPDAGPSSLYKKPESFEEQFQNLQAEEATSLTPTMLLITALELAVSTEEPPVLPATSPRSQVRSQLVTALYL